MVFVFLACIAVQYNDPDGPMWMVVYSAGLVFTLLHLFAMGSVTVLWAVAFLGFAGAAYIGWSVGEVETDRLVASLQMQGRGVEEVREASGLVIQSLWLVYLAWMSNRTAT